MPESSKLSSHTRRWITGVLVGLPVFTCILAGPPWSWWLLISIASAIGLWELHGLFFSDPLPVKWQVLSFAVSLSVPLCTHFSGLTGLNIALFLSLFAALSLMLISSPQEPEEITRIAHLSLAWLYVPYLLSFVLLLGTAPQGRFWIAFVLVVIVAGDAGAYHTGCRIGRRKLYEIVSPKKTIEGSVGGLALSIMAGSIFGLIFFRNVPLSLLVMFSLFVAITGQIGDLIESMLKRNFGKKDSSGLLPGHGGILDRLDSLLFAFPVMWSLLKWMVP